MKHVRPIPIGVEFYKKMIDGGYYYIDKTLLIKDILDQGITTALFTRPRCFGKTLAQSMLKTFFEREVLPDGTVADNSVYFKGKKIMEAGEGYLRHMGKYPVISLSLKSAKQPSYEAACEKLRIEIAKEYKRHSYVLDGDLLFPSEKKEFTAAMERTAPLSEYYTSLQFLSECLEKYHGQKVIILLDEYDVPLENAYFNGFYDEMVSFMRSLFESALKTNESLNLAVVTGCLRISRESIFTGLNNLKTISVLDDSYAEYFGFTQHEVDGILDTYGIAYKREEVKDWYDGYLFGSTEVYNPWSVVNYIYDIVYGNTVFPKPYWSNTSSNSIVRELIEDADEGTKQELEELVAGGTIEKPVHEDITYEDIYNSQDNLWNFLFFTGYLKAVKKSFRSRQIYLAMKIPNEEIVYIYENNIREWSERCIERQDLSGLIVALEEGDCMAASNIITAQLMEKISFYGNKEDYYHGFVAGLLKNNNKYVIKSNRESGIGRYDLALKTKRIRGGMAIILELKVADSINKLEQGCREALEQIERLRYADDILEEGYTDIIKYGICFYKKECLAMKV